MDYTVEILRFVADKQPVVVATLEWKYRTLEEAQVAGAREVELTAKSNGANGYYVRDETGKIAFDSSAHS